MLDKIFFLGNKDKKKEDFIRGVKEASLKSDIMMNETDKNLKYEAMIVLMNDLEILGARDISYDTVRDYLRKKSWNNINSKMLGNFLNKMKSDDFEKSVTDWILEVCPEEDKIIYMNALNALNTKF